MDKKIRWGILGPGNIAHKFVQGLKVLPQAELKAVGSRDHERAQAFADQYDIPNRYGSYEELAADPEIDAVYVATPHPFHLENTLLCLKEKKAVLCEKPMAINAQQVDKMIGCAKDNNVFLMEAMWTRFLPIMAQVRTWLNDEVIGDVRMVTADFGFRTEWQPKGRFLDLQLGGGALLDVGVYTISFASMIFNQKPGNITGMAHVGNTGVDEQNAIVLGYPKGQLAILSSAVRTNTSHEARIIGSKGMITIPEFWHATSATMKVDGQKSVTLQMPFKSSGYEYEAHEVMRCIQEGKLQSDVMPLKESMMIMDIMDNLRKQWGVTYPMEAGCIEV